jgi:cytochrome bd-type quinol oxidase subunit 1
VNYPIWDLPLTGGGLLIAAVAVIHVFISHFAIGGGLFLVLTEAKAYRESSPEMVEFVKKSGLLFVLITLVLGALTGVGIWFTIGLVSPSATSALIHIFVWAWAIEWVFFLVEIAAAFIYYYSWDRVPRSTHLAVGWIYFAAAWLSLFMINGILSFMMTPGGWLDTGSLWDGLLNPSFWPSLVLRTCVSVALAGLYVLIMAATLEPGALRERLTRWAGKWLWPPFIVMPFAGAWYLAVVPPSARAAALAAPVILLQTLSIVFSLLIFGFALLGPSRRPVSLSMPLAVLIATLGLMVTGTGEWVREAIRKPYIIYDYMYVNSIRPAEQAQVNASGVLPAARWSLVRGATTVDPVKAGSEVFRLECAACHTVYGYNAILPLVQTWPDWFIEYQLQHLDTLKGYMPPFVGTEEERKALAAYLARVSEE